MANLSREEFLKISRGDDPIHRSLWNGLPRISTPLQSPLAPVSYDGQVFDFFLPYPIHVFDDNPWPALHVRCASIEILLLKPISQPVTPQEQIARGTNEHPDLFGTVFHAIVERSSHSYPASHKAAFGVVHHALRWMRVLTRQYWIGTGSAGVAAKYRGTAFRVEGTSVYQMNFAHYGHSVLVRPLTRPIWDAMIYPVENETPVPTAQSIFCDSLTSFAVGDSVVALIQLGVACDIALSGLLDDLAALNPRSPVAITYLKARHEQKDKFGSKLLKYPLDFGCDDPRKFRPANGALNWTDQLLTLYRFRNKAAHEGRAQIKDLATGAFRDLQAGELGSFVFAVEALFEWIGNQQKVKFAPTNLPLRPNDQIIAIVGDVTGEGGFELQTGESHAQREPG
jgi:hypothetical protein